MTMLKSLPERQRRRVWRVVDRGEGEVRRNVQKQAMAEEMLPETWGHCRNNKRNAIVTIEAHFFHVAVNEKF